MRLVPLAVVVGSSLVARALSYRTVPSEAPRGTVGGQENARTPGCGEGWES
jgi:hypothetical protein